MRQLILTLIFLVFAGCNKYDHDTYNSYTVTDFTYAEQQEQTRLFTRQIAQNYIILKEIIYLVLKRSLYHPELHGMLNDPNQAQVRTCPTSSTTGSFPGTVDLLLDFGGAGGCTTTGLSPAQNTYTGSIKGEFNGPILSTITGTDFTLSTCGFSINGYTLSDVDINFNKNGSNFDIFLPQDLMVTKGNIKTTLHSSTSKVGILKNRADGTIPDDPDDPSTYIDNEFGIVISDNTITCENTATMASTDYCIDSSIDMVLQPSTCACLKDGRLRISDDGACNTPHTTYNFDSNPSGGNPNPGGCDEWVEEVTATGTVNLQMDSC